MTDFNKIKEAVEKRDAFLKENPQLIPLQEEINQVLLKAGNNSQRRQAALQEFMLYTWYKIVPVWEGK